MRSRGWRIGTALAAGAATIAAGAGPAAGPVQAAATSRPHAAASCPWLNTKLSATRRAEMVLARMTEAQKISMTYQAYPLDAHYGAAGYIPAISSLCLPALVFNDAGQGVGDAQTGTTAFPAPIAQSASWDPSLQYEFGQALGEEAHSKGIDVQLAPGIETDRVPENGRNWEYMSEDPFLSGQGAAAEVRGIQSEHVIVTIKHFIANSQETDRGSNPGPVDSAEVSLRTLEELYAPQYDVAIHEGGAMGVMCSYNRINRVQSCQNQETLGQILDKQFGFKGFVVSDWGATHSTVASAKAGLDIEMNVTPGTYFGPALEKAITAHEVSMATLNEMVLRILRAEFAVGVVNDPPAAQPAAYSANVASAAHRALAEKISEEGSVLLEDKDAILPLTSKDKTIALIGPGAGQDGAEEEYNGNGSGHIPEFGDVPVVSPLTGMTERAEKAHDTVLYDDGTSATAAAAVAKEASVAVVVVGDHESEGVDRSNLTLSSEMCTLAGCTPATIDQDALVSAVAAANPHTVVVLDTGGPVLMPWLAQVRGVLEAWYPGEEDGDALAALLFGDVDPSGHLTETFPASQKAQPIQSTRQWPGVTVKGDSAGPESFYSEGLLVGYRWYQAKHVKPLFPFGYGLSYTTFRLSHLRVRTSRLGHLRVRVSFTLTNTGHRAGADVAQVYVGDPRSTGEPPHQLKGDQRVSLAAGTSKQITIALPEVSFSHWSSRRRTWVVTKGRYGIAVGDSSAHLPLRATIRRAARVLPPSVW